MTLKELIATLTTAQEQATKGKWEWDEAEEDGKPWFSIDNVWVIGPQDAEGFLPEDLESIAIRHNTSGNVLRELRRQESDIIGRVAARCLRMRNHWRTRAEQAEAEVERLKVQIERERDESLTLMARMENNK